MRTRSETGATVLARAKVNLCLHVTGRRSDGLHELDSLVAFAGLADVVCVEPKQSGVSLRLDGGSPFASAAPDGEANVVWRAAARLAREVGAGRGARIRLDKRIPVGAGLGGGSAGAAATLLRLRRLWAPSMRDETLAALGFGIGADVPVCLFGRPARVRGAGERVDPVGLPAFWCVLVWPGAEVSTAETFAAFARSGSAAGEGLGPVPETFDSVSHLADWLRERRNDLLRAAEFQAPGLRAVGGVLTSAGALHAAMSGSGSAWWGLFAGEHEARHAVRRIRSARPSWWCEPARVEGAGRRKPTTPV